MEAQPMTSCHRPENGCQLATFPGNKVHSYQQPQEQEQREKNRSPALGASTNTTHVSTVRPGWNVHVGPSSSGCTLPIQPCHSSFSGGHIETLAASLRSVRCHICLLSCVATLGSLIVYLVLNSQISAYGSLPHRDYDKSGLEHGSLRYYLYNNTAMTQEPELKTIIPNREHVYRRENEFEKTVHALLQQHQMRTTDPELADVFIIPTPIGQFFLYEEGSYDKAFSELLSVPTFQQGNQHGIVAIVDHFVNEPFSRWFPRLQNVTIVRSYDPNMCRELAELGGCKGHDFCPLFSNQLWHSTKTMSYGLPPEPDVPFLPATYEKFVQSPLFFFYRTTRNGSRYNSTQYRHAPLHVEGELELPRHVENSRGVSIGFDLDHASWIHDLTHSKFCLVIRGDTPHSHALLTAVQVGCIPVVISDHYPSYAPTLWLDMRKFCIFIREIDFLSNPALQLNRIIRRYGNDGNTVRVREKLDALAFAQRLLLVDHPKSLFVSALVKGIYESSR